MNPLQIGAAVAALVAAGMWCVSRSMQRAPRTLAAAREQMFGPLASAPAAPGVARTWVERHFGSGLQVVDLTPLDVVTRIVTAAGIMLLAVLGAVAALMAMDLLPLSPIWPALAVAFAAMAGWVSLRDVADKIERRRREFRQASNDFVQLVAVGLTTDQSVEEAIRFALSVGSSTAFDSLRQQVSTAPQRGVAVWEAIAEFGHRYDVREVVEFANSIERQGLQGVSISETVATLAGAMRAKALDELEREADKANANLSGPTIGFVVTTIVFLAYPLAQRITDAFGG